MERLCLTASTPTHLMFLLQNYLMDFDETFVLGFYAVICWRD
jgi:hypothetical protein